MIGVYDYTVIATYAALFTSMFGIFACLNGNPMVGVLCLMVCGGIDCFDGKIARTKKDRTEVGKLFGIQIDSLNDLVCFGVLPAIIGFTLGMTGFAASLILCLFVLCGLIRLAYFNVMEEKRQQETDSDRTAYLGLPITTSSMFIPLAVLLVEYARLPHLLTLCIAYLILSFAFIAPISVKKLNVKKIVIAGIMMLAEFILVIKAI